MSDAEVMLKFRPNSHYPVAEIGWKGAEAFQVACKTGIAFCPYAAWDDLNLNRNWLFGYVREWSKLPWTLGMKS